MYTIIILNPVSGQVDSTHKSKEAPKWWTTGFPSVQFTDFETGQGHTICGFPFKIIDPEK